MKRNPQIFASISSANFFTKPAIGMTHSLEIGT